MQIFIITCSGKRFLLQAEPSDTIGSVKAQIDRQENIRADKQRLVYEGVTLLNGNTLSDYGVPPHCTIALMVSFCPS